MPQVDADGDDLDGIRNVFVQVPIGTYTGWNLFNHSFFEDGFCTLQGSFIPFARTKAAVHTRALSSPKAKSREMRWCAPATGGGLIAPLERGSGPRESAYKPSR